MGFPTHILETWARSVTVLHLEVLGGLAAPGTCARSPLGFNGTGLANPVGCVLGLPTQ